MKINNKGFTLIEMLVVVAIIGLLSAVVVVGLTGAREQARDSRRIADIRQIQNDLELEYSSADGYPGQSNFDTPDDPTGEAYVYESPVDGDSHTYKLGIGLETEENNNYSTDICPGDVSSPAFCVTPGTGTGSN